MLIFFFPFPKIECFLGRGGSSKGLGDGTQLDLDVKKDVFKENRWGTTALQHAGLGFKFWVSPMHA